MSKDFSLNKYEKFILDELFSSSNGLFAFTLYSRYKIKPQVIARLISKLQEQDIIQYNNGKLNLTSTGKEYLLLNNKILRTEAKNRKEIPYEFVSSKIDINSPYLPDRSSIPSDILSNRKVE